MQSFSDALGMVAIHFCLTLHTDVPKVALTVWTNDLLIKDRFSKQFATPGAAYVIDTHVNRAPQGGDAVATRRMESLFATPFKEALLGRRAISEASELLSQRSL